MYNTLVRCSLVIHDKPALSNCRHSDSHSYLGGFAISRKPSLLACLQALPTIGSSAVFEVPH